MSFHPVQRLAMGDLSWDHRFLCSRLGIIYLLQAVPALYRRLQDFGPGSGTLTGNVPTGHGNDFGDNDPVFADL